MPHIFNVTIITERIHLVNTFFTISPKTLKPHFPIPDLSICDTIFLLTKKPVAFIIMMRITHRLGPQWFRRGFLSRISVACRANTQNGSTLKLNADENVALAA